MTPFPALYFTSITSRLKILEIKDKNANFRIYIMHNTHVWLRWSLWYVEKNLYIVVVIKSSGQNFVLFFLSEQ